MSEFERDNKPAMIQHLDERIHGPVSGHEYTSVFDIHCIMPEVMYPIPYVGVSPYNNGDMIVYIGKKGGGKLGQDYVNQRWFGEVRYYPNGLGEEFTILHSAEFHINTITNHISAAVDYAEVVALLAEGDWTSRIAHWATNAFEGSYTETLPHDESRFS